MSTQSEAILEANLITQLVGLGYEKVSVTNEEELLANLKKQLERHNKTTLDDIEFARILNHLNKGNVFEKAKILRDKYALSREDGTTKYIEFLDSEHWCQNLFQVTHRSRSRGVIKTAMTSRSSSTVCRWYK